MEVTFYNFRKRINSTKLVNVSGTTISFVYKETSERNNPVIEVTTWNDNWNYAKIGSKYFFVDTLEYLANRHFRVSLSIDLLASYRNDVMATTAYISRATGIYNDNIIDELNTPLTAVTETVLSETPKIGEQLFYDTGNGCFILHTLNSTQGGELHGAFTTAYILNGQQMTEIAQILTTTDQSIIDAISIGFNKPIDAIFKVLWLPLNINVVAVQSGAVSTNVWIGAYNTNISAYCIATNLLECRTQFIIDGLRPEGYLRNPAFINAVLTLPFVGTVGIDCKRLFENDASGSLIVDIAVDAREGKQLIVVRTSEHQSTPLNVFETVIAYPCQVGSATINFLGGITNALNGIALASVGQPLFGATAIANSFYDVAVPSCSAIGTNGGNMAEITLGGNIRLVIIKRLTKYDIYNETVRQTVGLPFNDVMMLGDIAEKGFVKCSNASVSTNAYKHEIDALNDFLNGGVFIE